MSEIEIKEMLLKHWKSEREYTIQEMRSIFKSYRQKSPTRQTIRNWIEIGIQKGDTRVFLKAYRVGRDSVVRGEFLIEFILETNR